MSSSSPEPAASSAAICLPSSESTPSLPARTCPTRFEVVEEMRAVRPAAVVHLAAMSSVGASWRGSGEVWRVNAVGTVNVLDAVAAEQPGGRVLVASTGEVDGTATVLPTPKNAEIAPL